MMGRRPAKAVERVETPILSSFYVRLLIVGVLVLGSAFFIGTSDGGQINVAGTIQSSNEAAIEAGGSPVDNVTATPESLRNLPNGGLVPAGGNQSEPAPVVEAPSAPEETASTTEGGEGDTEETESTPAGEVSGTPATE